jgi:hypothetical protein
LPKLRKKFTGKELSIIVLDAEKDVPISKVKRYFRRIKLKGATVFAADRSEIIEYFHVENVPTMWLIDKNGVLLHKDLNNEADAEMKLAAKLGKKTDEATQERAKVKTEI